MEGTNSTGGRLVVSKLYEVTIPSEAQCLTCLPKPVVPDLSQLRLQFLGESGQYGL